MLRARMETRFEELKRYVRFVDDDAARLLAFRDIARPHFERIAQEFYERIREHEDAHAVFTGEDQIKRLQRSLVVWLERVLGGVYDEGYFQQTWRIGQVHVKVGLPQRYMFTAMALVRSSLLSIIETSETSDRGALRDAVNRLLDLDLAIMLDSYGEDLMSRIERAAHVTEHRYVNAVELAAVIVIGLGRNGEIVFFNRHAEQMTGWARDEAIGRSFAELLLPDDARETYAPRFSSAITEGEVDIPLKTRAGKVRDVLFRVARAPASDDIVTAFAVGSDVTEERAARIRAQQAERLAAVGTLAAGLAHEIRNPLNGAQLHVSFLERALKKSGGRGAGDADALEAVEVVRDEIKRLARLVTDFLDFARPRPLVTSPLTVRALVEKVVPLVTTAADASHVKIVVDLPAAELTMEVDRERLQQVLLNLMQNAIEALARGGTVTVRARREPRHAVIDVEDDGPGLPSESAPIFDAFFSTKPAGTGLGLALVHRIVTDHGGTIDVDSRPGRTQFRIRLPLTQQGRA